MLCKSLDGFFSCVSGNANLFAVRFLVEIHKNVSKFQFPEIRFFPSFLFTEKYTVSLGNKNKVQRAIKIDWLNKREKRPKKSYLSLNISISEKDDD